VAAPAIFTKFGCGPTTLGIFRGLTMWIVAELSSGALALESDLAQQLAEVTIQVVFA
jgi:hypothetical protein